MPSPFSFLSCGLVVSFSLCSLIASFRSFLQSKIFLPCFQSKLSFRSSCGQVAPFPITRSDCFLLRYLRTIPNLPYSFTRHQANAPRQRALQLKPEANGVCQSRSTTVDQLLQRLSLTTDRKFLFFRRATRVKITPISPAKPLENYQGHSDGLLSFWEHTLQN